MSDLLILNFPIKMPLHFSQFYYLILFKNKKNNNKTFHFHSILPYIIIKYHPFPFK